MSVVSQSPNWNAGQYARFGDHRLRPAIDLINRIPDHAFSSIVDLGCGNGRVTPLLKDRWPDAMVTGVDSSEDMLNAARASNADIIWQHGDIATWTAGDEELIFSNAAFHWLDDHEALITRLVSGLPAGGVLAFQVPDNFDQPSHQIMREVAADARWADRLQDIASRTFVAAADDYWRWLDTCSSDADVWLTIYEQVLTGDDPVFEWLKGAGMRPYLNRLAADEVEVFEDQCRARLAEAYPVSADGTTLFPFRRLFAIAVR